MNNLIAFAQVLAPAGGLSILQTIVIVAILGVIASFVDRATFIEETFRMLIRWICVIAAVVLLVVLLLRMVGLG